jgi:hypothetical protein
MGGKNIYIAGKNGKRKRTMAVHVGTRFHVVGGTE